MQHWKQHKPNCTWIKEHYVKCKEDMSKVLPDSSALDSKEGPCAICLEETITNPVVLPCGHAFCFSCVGKYQQSYTSKEGASCPYCRGEIPEVVDNALDRSILYGDRAVASSKGSEDQKKYAKLSLAEFESLMEVIHDGDEESQMNLLHTRAEMMSMADQPEEVRTSSSFGS